jgi:AcrR family transcriptional regulator
MPRKPAEPGVDRRQQILAAALEIFAEQGFESATNKAIAERAGVNQGLIYFYFASKADVCFATLAYHTSFVTARLDAVFTQANVDADEVSQAAGFACLLKDVVHILASPPGSHLLRIMYQMNVGLIPRGAVSHPEEQQATGGLARHLHQCLRAYLEMRVAQGTFAVQHLSLLAQILTRTLIANVTLRTQGNDKLDLDVFAETMAQVYCYGLVPRTGYRTAE